MTAQLSSAVVGDGFLARHLAGRRADLPALVLVAELDRLGEHHDTIVECLGTGRPLLFVGTWRSFVYVGPYWAPGSAGCPHCLVTRTANSPFGPDFAGQVLAESGSRDPGGCVLGPAVLGMVEQYVRAAVGGDSVEPGLLADGSVVVIDGQNGTAERRRLLPDSTCASCGTTSGETAPVFTEAPLVKLAPTTLRTAELDAETVEREYLFSGFGLFTEVRQDLQSPIGACSVELSTRWGRREPAIGRGRSYRTSRTIAVLEGLERYAGLHRGGRRAPVRAAYREVADTAVYPPELGTHPRESYRDPAFAYREFHPNTVVDWVWAYSFRRRDRVLIPERSAFWGPRHDGEVSFTYDTSNGCALGNSVEEAILHGLREVAERDSFLLTWYRKLALPEVDLTIAPEPLRALLRKARLFTGFGFRAFQSTMEYGMPTFWLVAENEAAEPGSPLVLAGAGSHPDPAQAIVGGMHELIGSVMATQHSYQRRRADGLAMLDDPNRILRMEDHSLVGALPEARDRYAFLLDGDHEHIALADVPGLVTTGSDLRVDLDLAVSGVLAAGLDVLVVDQTMPELSRTGLACVRVIVPGAVPMTFGHRNRRTTGLSRLTDGTTLPYRSTLDVAEEVGCVPHPFP